MIRIVYAILFALFIIMLTICGIVSYRSKKPIGHSVSNFCISLIPAVLGNMIIILSTSKSFALVGCYMFYIGMDLIMFALIKFTYKYCPAGKRRSAIKLAAIVYALLGIDVVQMLLNPLFGHAFQVQKIKAYGAPYYILIPLWGQTFHRIVCYGAIIMVLLIFLITIITVSRIYRERYSVIFISMVLGTLWQSFYIFSRTPIDRSMIGFCIAGLLIFYFSIYYRPLRLLDSMLADIVSETQEAVFLYGPLETCIWINDPAYRLTKVKEDEFEQADEVLISLFGDTSDIPEETDTEFTIGSGKSARYYILSRGRFTDRKGRNLGTYTRVKDITAEKRRIELELFATNHDALTGVYTKEYTYKKISDRLKKQELKDHYLISIQICDFKMFNDVFGRDYGDDALRRIVSWMEAHLDDRCIYGRIKGNTFGACLPKEMFVWEDVENFLANFRIKKENIEHHLIIQLGVYEIEKQDQNVSAMFDRTLLALESIRDNYKKHVAFFNKELRDKMLRNQEMSSQLLSAIEENQIRPYLQPIVDNTGRIVGAEALARWIHPEHGLISPAEFIPLFEKNGMIVDLDKHIWRSACEILSGWKETHPDLFVSINVSPNDLYLTDVLEDMKGLVKEYDIPLRNLRIEITETIMMKDSGEKLKVLDDLRKLGFIVEMDDFGSGYSSLNMLKDMPVDLLKIDMYFLGKTGNLDRANAIIKNIIQLSKELGIISLTEGVETQEQFRMLSNMGCKLFQGYYFSKPVPQTEFESMLCST